MKNRSHTSTKKISAGEPTPTEIFEYALRALLTRPYSIKELQTKLKKKYPEHLQVIETTITRLIDLRYLNDDEYAEKLTKNRLNIKKKGLYWIAQELQRNNIRSQKIQEIMRDAQEDENESIQGAFEKKLRTIKASLPREEKKQKILQYLQRRGYPMEKILKLLNSL